MLVAVLFGLAELPFAAFMADDLMQLVVLEHVAPRPWLGPLDLYTISDGVPAHVRAMQDAGALPWFFPTDFKMAFFRPLSSASMAVDHAVWGLWPVGYRLQGSLWFMALVAAVGLVRQRTLPGPIGTLALGVFTISGIHGMLAWNATRHVVIAGALGMLALAAHVRWRETGWRAGRILAVAGFALAFGASEAAFAAVTYLLAYETLGAPGDARERVRALAPVLVLAGSYLLGYRLAGFGTAGGFDYIDPLATPAAFVLALPGRVLFLCGALLSGGNADLWTLERDARPALVAVAAAIVVAFVGVLRTVWHGATPADRRGVRWLVAGGAAATVPFAGTPIGTRCLVLPMIGGSVAIAFVVHAWWRAKTRSRGLAVAGVLLVVVHLVAAPIGRLATPYWLRRMLSDRVATAMQRTELDVARLPSQRVVVLRAPDFMMGLHPFVHRTLYRMPMPRSWRTLSWARAVHRFTRTGADTLELALVGGSIAAPDLREGQVIALDGMTVTVLARDPHGPTRVRFQLDRSLDDPDVVLLAWDEDRFRRVAAPTIGTTLSLADGSLRRGT